MVRGQQPPNRHRRKAFKTMITHSVAAPFGGRRILSSLVAVMAAVVLWGLLPIGAASAAETRPPLFVKLDFGHEIYSTRVQIEGQMEPEGLVGEWKAEYSESCNGPWTEVNKTVTSSPTSSASVYIGATDPGVEVVLEPPHFLRHLAPDTSYCARFTAKNADGQATPEVVPFKTPQVAKPEVDKKDNGKFTDNGHPQFKCSASSDTSMGCRAEIEGNGAETTYSFEYAPPEPGGGRPSETSGSWTKFSSGATGTLSVAEEYGDVEAQATGVAPETDYYVRLKMRNSAGETVQSVYTDSEFNEFDSVRIPTAKPRIDNNIEFRNVTSSSAVALAGMRVSDSETHWRFEYAQSLLGPWSVAPGAEGTISQAQVEAQPFNHPFKVTGRLTGLSSATVYYVRLFAENTAGEGKVCFGKRSIEVEREEMCEAVSVADRVAEGFPGSFETAGLPSVSTFMVHALIGEQLQLDGEVNAKSEPTTAEQTVTVEGAPTGGTFTLTFGGQTTSPIAYDAPADEGEGPGSVGAALHGVGFLGGVEGSAGGPYTVVFTGAAGVSEPQIECHSELTPASGCTVHTLFKGGEAGETHYYFQYASQTGFAEHGWSEATATPEQTASLASGAKMVYALLPVLPAGETYHYRLVAKSSIAGSGLIEGTEETLKVPSFTMEPTPSPCPNEAFRTGLSAHLPDCRAYELVTPVDKGGSQEPFEYNSEIGAPIPDVHAGEDGAHIVLEGSTVHWGSGVGAGDSPYFFSRVAGRGWTMTSGAPQPASGIASLLPQVYSGDLSQWAFESRYAPSPATQSEKVEYEVGPPGGPYTTVASLPRTETGAWVATSASGSKMVFETSDHSLLGKSTGTRSGDDLYEYTAQGGLRQLNVSGESATTICSGGAAVVQGREANNGGEYGGGSQLTGTVTNLNTVSSDGSRVFFYAGSPSCSGGDLYVRVDGSQTFDIGPYNFIGGNEQGTVLLLENSSGELFGYDSETGKLEPQADTEKAMLGELGFLGIPYQAEPRGGEAFFHPRYTYWSSGREDETRGFTRNLQGEPSNGKNGQVYRYDNVEHLVECVSCASSYDPEPKQPAFLQSAFGQSLLSPYPLLRTTSADGRYAFFTTPSALLPQDIDGEAAINSEPIETGEHHDVKGTTSVSSDIYEWRAAGVDSCEHAQGCLSLITDGRGGYLNILLGSAEEGREVFIYTRSKLVSQDVDTAGDIYAVRVDGGFAPPSPRPTECEGDACSTPPPAPNDATPSSLTFNGMGNAIENGKPPSPSQKSLRRSQQLARALKMCHKDKRSRKRVVCERDAHKRYGARGVGAKKAAAGRAGRVRSGRAGGLGK
jgi:hypothetical protein